MLKMKPGFPDFTEVDGPFAGVTFRKGALYAKVPPAYADRFEDEGGSTEERPSGLVFDDQEAEKGGDDE